METIYEYRERLVATDRLEKLEAIADTFASAIRRAKVRARCGKGDLVEALDLMIDAYTNLQNAAPRDLGLELVRDIIATKKSAAKKYATDPVAEGGR